MLNWAAIHEVFGMENNMNRIILQIVLISFILSLSTKGFCWDVEIKREVDGMHQNLSRYSAEVSMLRPCTDTDVTNCDFLLTIGLPGGFAEYLTWGSKNRIKDWIATGAQLEDAGTDLELMPGGKRPRYLNHFHNPLHEWNFAGLDDVSSGKSSVLWAQDNSAQNSPYNPEGNWTWSTIREFYHQALTGKTDSERQEYFARTFRGLGHQLHLLQDKAVPAHVRNDAHILKENHGILTFEHWAEGKFNSLDDIKAFFPKDSDNKVIIPRPSVPMNVEVVVGGTAYMPITQLADTNQYDGSNPSAYKTIGLAEYTNANFVSDDTIFTEDQSVTDKHYFPYPRRTSTNLADSDPWQPDWRIAKDGILDQVINIKKVSDGEVIDKFLTVSYHSKKLWSTPWSRFKRTFYLDEECHKAYAEKLLPRAVGYSAALLDYFFRGDIDMARNFNGGGYIIKNNSDEQMTGTFALYYDDVNDNRYLAKNAMWTLTIAAGGRSQPVSFTPPDDAKEPGKYMLVFRGQMGNENDAVVGKLVLSEGPAFYLNFLRDDGKWMTSADMSYLDPEDYDELYYGLEVISGANGFYMIVNIDWINNYTMRISMPRGMEDVDDRHPYKEDWWPVEEGGPDGEWPKEGVWLEFWGGIFNNAPSFQIPYIYIMANWEQEKHLQQPGNYIVQVPYWNRQPYTISTPASSVEYACSANGEQSGRGPISISSYSPPRPPYYEEDDTTYFDSENSVERGFNLISSIPYQVTSTQINSYDSSKDEYKYPVYSWVYYGHLNKCLISKGEGPPPLWEAVNEYGTVVRNGGDKYHKDGMWGTAGAGGESFYYRYDNTFAPYAPVSYRRHFIKTTNIPTGSRQFSYKAYYNDEWHTRQAFYNWTKGIRYGYPAVVYNTEPMSNPPPLPDPLPPFPQ